MDTNAADTQGLSIVVIEDNPGDYVLVEDYLIEKFQSIAIKQFIDYKSVFDYLNGEDYKCDLILLDLHLPDKSGLELVKNIVAISSKIPIIILTGYSDITLAQKSLQLGVYDFLIKDEINPTLLHKSIEFTINRRSYIKQVEDEKLNYEGLFNFSPQPMWLLEFDTLNILNANFSAIQKYGYPIKKLKEMSFLQFHTKEETELIKIKIAAKQSDFNNQHFTHILNDGKEIKVDIYCKEMKRIAGKDFIIVQSNDISDTLNHINTIEIQNEKLRTIAWTQSHVVRAPLSRILGIINLMEEDQKENLEDILFWLAQIKVSTQEMDEVVKKIVEEAQHLR